MTQPPDKSLMRSLGEFVGHVLHGVKRPVGPAAKQVRTDVQERTLPGGVVLRRTTIEEVQMPPGGPAPDPRS